MGEEFDVEEYRADLTRRRDALRELAYSSMFPEDKARIAAKAVGIEIALDLLPEIKVEESR